MKILFISQLPPLPLDAGPKLRSYFVLQRLAEQGHQVSLVCFGRPSDDLTALDGVRRLFTSVDIVPLARSGFKNLFDAARSLAANESFLVLRDQLDSMRGEVARLVSNREFDAVHCDQLWMAPYGLVQSGRARTVLDQHNAVHVVLERLAQFERNPIRRHWLRHESAKLKSFEQDACDRFDRVVWVTKEDQEAVHNGSAPRSAQSVIPIALDPRQRKVVRRKDPFRVTFLGGMHWPPNADGVCWFADKVWPRIRASVPRAVLTLIGKKPPSRLQGLGAAGRIDAAGYVENLAPYLDETSVIVVPLRCGAGMRVKILDSWSWGLPVVSTSVGAEGIDYKEGEEILIADDPQAFAESVIRVMENAPLNKMLSDAGRMAVESRYDWRNVYQAWDQVYA